MCQCGCGEFPVTHAYELPSGEVIGYGIYRGCSDCFSGPGVSFYVYPNAKSEWPEQAKMESYAPDEYGGNQGTGIAVSFFEVRDLIKATKEIGGELSDDAYSSVEEWLEDYGLQMMQRAMELFTERCAKLTKGNKDGG